MCLILMIELARVESKKKLWLCLGFAEVGLKAIMGSKYISGGRVADNRFCQLPQIYCATLDLKPFYTM